MGGTSGQVSTCICARAAGPRNQVQGANCQLLRGLGERTERWIASHKLRYRNHILYSTGHLGHPHSHLALLGGRRLLGGHQRRRLRSCCWRRVAGGQDQKHQSRDGPDWTGVHVQSSSAALKAV
jgi:hypothetical protein